MWLYVVQKKNKKFKDFNRSELLAFFSVWTASYSLMLEGMSYVNRVFFYPLQPYWWTSFKLTHLNKYWSYLLSDLKSLWWYRVLHIPLNWKSAHCVCHLRRTLIVMKPNAKELHAIQSFQNSLSICFFDVLPTMLLASTEMQTPTWYHGPFSEQGAFLHSMCGVKYKHYMAFHQI